jgi:hypothetical protein
MKAADLMTTNVVTIADDATAQDAAVLMLGNRISALPVLDRSGKLVGIVARANLLQALAGLKVETPVRQAGKDAEIREEILARLSGAPWRPWLFNVTVHDGVVDLWGIANAAEAKNAAGVAAENAPGVFSVNNHIIVRPHNWAEAKPFFATGAKER